ncbi:hypothetical protein [Tamaricihabitans halophyticus]|uniref:hypothetical protein n=1 Tax=Tamaricihabitans halophyticus TaxID=1262583 RepID=UPI00105401E6|nr:hypothetical protein [Tamaricihabitans halophyticus]
MRHSSMSCLDLIETRFTSLTRGRQPLSLDGTPLRDLQVQILKRRTDPQTKAIVWKKLVLLARAQSDPWEVAAIGMMLPGLKSIGGKLGSRYPSDRRDLDSAILEGFCHSLRNTDTWRPDLPTVLYRAAVRSGENACNRENHFARRHFELPADMPEERAQHVGNVDVVLAGAMLDGALTPLQAELVSDVHLEHRRRVELARRLGTSRGRIAVELAAAERGLAEYLAA